MLLKDTNFTKNVGEHRIVPGLARNEPICIYMLSKLIHTPRGHRYLLLITERFRNIKNTIPMKGISVVEVDKHILDNWVLNHGPPTKLLADKGKRSRPSSSLTYVGSWTSIMGITPLNKRTSGTIQPHLHRLSSFLRQWSSPILRPITPDLKLLV